MKDIMKTNIYDVEDTIIIVGSCLKYREPEGFEKLKEFSIIFMSYVLKKHI